MTFHLLMTLFQRTGQTVDIAMKMLQPVDPGQAATPSQKQQYNVGLLYKNYFIVLLNIINNLIQFIIMNIINL